jgi:putative hemolysin
MGVTLIGILTGIYSGESLTGPIILFLTKFPALEHYAKPIATAITVVLITYLSLVIGELVPKRIGLSKPEAIAKILATPMEWVAKITYPFIWLLTKSTHVIATLFGIRRNESAVTEEEIKAMISEGTEHGDIEETEQEIIERVFHLGDRNITSLMTHRSDIIWMDINARVADVKEKMKEVIHNTYPLCDGVIDNIKGMIPFIGDIFDFAFKANIRNMKLMHQHYAEGRHRGSAWKIILPILTVLLAIVIGAIWVTYKLFAGIFN